MGILGLQHAGHQVRHGPHALTDLGTALEATGQTDVHVPVFIGLDPSLLLHITLTYNRASLHGGVDFITGTVQEARVNKDHTVFSCTDTFFQVHRGAALFIHDAHFQGMALDRKSTRLNSSHVNMSY